MECFVCGLSLFLLDFCWSISFLCYSTRFSSRLVSGSFQSYGGNHCLYVAWAIILFVILLLSASHFNHIFVWMDADVVANDKVIQGKSSFLNIPFFLIRAAVFLAGWLLYRFVSRKYSLKQDN